MKATTKPAQFTPGPWHVEKCSAPVYGSDGMLMVNGVGIGAGSRHIGTISSKNAHNDARLIAAAPAMYEALTDAERMWNIARMIDSKHHAGNPISNDLWSDFHRYLMEWHAKRKAALAQAEGR